MELFTFQRPKNFNVPIIISIPHSGTFVPDNIAKQMSQAVLQDLDDTDWFVDKLYEFAFELGIPIVRANYSRLVIDLNRSKDNAPLYSDGRQITGIIPQMTFKGEAVYRTAVEEEEVEFRIGKYYEPYYQFLQSQLEELLEKFNQVLLFDAHSIRNFVPSISKEPFADLILSDQDHKTCSPDLFVSFFNELTRTDLEVEQNSLFKGGNITRHFGKPEAGINAIQLEMNKLCYMDNTQRHYHEENANNIRRTLSAAFQALINYMK